MKRALIVLAATCLALTPSLARQCPQDMAKIDAALRTAQLSDTDRAQVLKLREDGEKLHKDGNHSESEASLAKAKTILKIQ